MKNKLLIFILALSLTACTKDAGECWTCKLTNGETKKGCGIIPTFRDNNGNDLGSLCNYR